MTKVSVIISTYNRYKFLINAINSVKTQTYKNIEIIVVNDGSTETEYYIKSIKGIKMYHLKKNSKDVIGFPCMSIPKNYGLKKATGDYIAFLDDDDIWFPKKIEKQLKKLNKPKNIDIKMISTNAYTGKGLYDKHKTYNKYFNTEIPTIFDLNYIKKHNSIILSSCLIHKDIIKKVGYLDELPLGGKHKGLYEDYEYWKRCLKYTKCLYINKPLIYYDQGHGYGNDY
jgi:glycosyltransferase involved in cell wall biosynthesis